MRKALFWRLGLLLVLAAGCSRTTPLPPAPAEPGPALVEQPLAPAPVEPGFSSPPSQPQRPQPLAPASASPTPAASEPIRKLAAAFVEPVPGGGWRINQEAALALEKQAPTLRNDLFQLLTSSDASARRGAAFYLLNEFNPDLPSEQQALARLMADEDEAIRGIALQAAWKFRDADRAAAALAWAPRLTPQTEPKPQHRAALCRLIAGLKLAAAPTAPQLAAAAQDDPDPQVRGAALVALGEVASPAELAAACRTALQDEQAAVRLTAAARLRKLGASAAPAQAELAKALADRDSAVRLAAAESLVKIGAPAVAAIAEQLKSDAAETRKLAVACLASLGPVAQSAAPSLRLLLADPVPELRTAAQQALAAVGEPGAKGPP